MRTIGTVVRGVRAPIVRQGDNIAAVAAEAVMEAWKEAGITPCDRDVVAVTESVVARAQGKDAGGNQHEGAVVHGMTCCCWEWRQCWRGRVKGAWNPAHNTGAQKRTAGCPAVLVLFQCGTLRVPGLDQLPSLSSAASAASSAMSCESGENQPPRPGAPAATRAFIVFGT